MQVPGFQLPLVQKKGVIATRFIKNHSVAEVLARIQTGSLPELWTATGIAKLVTGLVLGMKFIHRQSAIHRNLKPSNLFITDDCLQIGDLAF
jgi:serine/threonine protein kinase